MIKFDYFIYAIKNNLYLHRAWLLSSFGILPDNESNDFFEIKNKKLKVKISNNGIITYEDIIDFKYGQPLFHKDERCTIPNNIISFIEGKQESTYGIFIINCLMLWYPYQGKAKYINGKITDKVLNKTAYDLLKNNVVSVEEHKKFEDAANMISCLAQVSVPSATRKAITPNPKVKAFKEKLLKENRDKLSDPAVIADIQKQIVDMDKEYLKGDVSLGFFIKDKNFNVTRLKLMGMYGAEPDFYDGTKLSLMETSLTEGWSKDNMQMLVNNLRSGSYGRGKETALGGESTKVTSRIFQNYRIESDDCLTKLGMDIKITDKNYKLFIGRYEVGSKDPLTSKDLEAYAKKNTVITLRSPAFCASPNTTYCKKCMGEQVLESGLGINSQCIIVTSTFMSVAMSSVHSRALTISRYDYKNLIQ